MFAMTLIHFTILSLKGGAFYNYYHYYADKAAMYDWLAYASSDGAAAGDWRAAPAGVLEFLGYVVHADPSNLANSNVADVANSVINVIEKIVFIIVIVCSPLLSKLFGKKRSRWSALDSRRLFGDVLSAQAHRHLVGWSALTVDRGDHLWADDSAALGDVRRRGRLFGMEKRPAAHRHRVRDDRLCTQSGAEPGSVCVAYDPCRHMATRPMSTKPWGHFMASASARVSFRPRFSRSARCYWLAYKINKRLTIQIADELAKRRAAAANL